MSPCIHPFMSVCAASALWYPHSPSPKAEIDTDNEMIAPIEPARRLAEQNFKVDVVVYRRHGFVAAVPIFALLSQAAPKECSARSFPHQ